MNKVEQKVILAGLIATTLLTSCGKRATPPPVPSPIPELTEVPSPTSDIGLGPISEMTPTSQLKETHPIELKGHHYELLCFECHTPPTFTTLSNYTCGDCHTKPHSFGSDDCAQCHYDGSTWTEINEENLDHTAIWDEYEPHERVACKSCHSEGYHPPPTNCDDCHESSQTEKPPTVTSPATSTIPSLTPCLTVPLYDKRETAVQLLTSYYNAINRREYHRAWEHWESPPAPSYEDFAQGYAATASVFLVIHPPTHQEGAAGSVYTAIPTLLSATHTDGSVHNYAGCYVARRPSPGAQSTAVPTLWSLYDAEVSATSGNTTDVTVLAQACNSLAPNPPDIAYENREDPIALLASYYNAINRQEYRRAWDYWETSPNPSYEDFVEGYAETTSIFLAVNPPIQKEDAASRLYVSIPTLLSATHNDSSTHNYVGCFVTHRPSPGAQGTPWSLYDAAISATPGNGTDATLLKQACTTR